MHFDGDKWAVDRPGSASVVEPDRSSCEVVPNDGFADGVVVVDNALWIWACVTFDDAPTWLIYDTPDGAITWQRVPEKVQPFDLVDARLSAGGHADPAEVLRWLRGDASHPWSGGGDGVGDLEVVDALRLRIHGRSSEQ